MDFAKPAHAQISSDNTLSTQVNSADGLNFTIDQGDRAGNSLFHSFEQFSIPTNGSAHFNNALDIDNIFSRVTGNSASVLDGLLQANGNANLFLLNPNGIEFGTGAQLQLGGSFYGTTAQTLRFADGVEFTASVAAQPTVTVSLPVGLQFGQTPGSIQVQGPGHDLAGTLLSPIDRSTSPQQLSLSSGQTFALVGGALDFSGAVLSAPEGRIELGAAGSGTTVGLTPTGNSFSLDYSNTGTLGNITLDQRSLADVSGAPSGSIQLAGAEVNLLQGSLLLGQNLGTQAAGDIVIQATSFFNATGTNPDTATRGIGSGATNETLGTGAGGDIFVSTPQLTLTGGSSLYTKTFSSASGGDIEVEAPESIDIIGTAVTNPLTFSVINALAFSLGNGGDVTASTETLTIAAGGSINSGNIGAGSGGNVLVNADVITVEGVRPVSLSESNIGVSNVATGQVGSLTINTRQLFVRNGALVTGDNSGNGSAGTVVINASELVEVQGRDLESNTKGAFIGANTLRVNPELAEIFGLPEIPTGDAGSVTINTPVLRVLDGGRITANNEGLGDAGIVQIQAGAIVLDNQANIDASSSLGQGGVVDVIAGVLSLDHDSFIAADAIESGDAGTISLSAPLILLNHGSTITANASETGSAGTINLNALLLAGYNNSDIVALSEQGQTGTIHISAPLVLGLKPSTQLTSGNNITPIPTRSYVFNLGAYYSGNTTSGVTTNPLSASLSSSTALASNSGVVLTGPSVQVASGTTVPIPAQAFAYGHGIDTPQATCNTKSDDVASATIVEATGWQLNEQGQMSLVSPQLTNCSR